MPEPPRPALCRDCGWRGAETARCGACGSPRVIAHRDLFDLSVAHVDCDAFYASVEKRDDPSLADKPVIVGGGRRGVVATCCYIARLYGVRSAMPMFKALAACPDAVVIKPDMAKYVAVSRAIRAKMDALTPLVEPLSLDEAFLDLSGTATLHGRSPAESVARLAREIEAELGVTVSVGLAANKFLAKIASELDKPRGFAVLGAEAAAWLADRPVSIIWGVGARTAEKLAEDGLRTVGDLRAAGPEALIRRYGATGARLARLAWGEDARSVAPRSEAKSISAETTFERDLSGYEALEAKLWPLCERVAARLKSGGFAARTAVLKLKTARFRTVTRQAQIVAPTQLAVDIFAAVCNLLQVETKPGAAFRLIGVGVETLVPATETPQTSEKQGELFSTSSPAAEAERAIDAVRARFGDGAIKKGRSLR